MESAGFWRYAFWACDAAVWFLVWRLGLRVARIQSQPERRRRGLIWVLRCLPLTLIPSAGYSALEPYLQDPGGAQTLVVLARTVADALMVRLPLFALGLLLLGLTLGLWTQERIDA